MPSRMRATVQSRVFHSDMAESHRVRRRLGYYKKLIQEDPNDPQAWVAVGNLLQRQGQLHRAIEAYARAIERYAVQGRHEMAVSLSGELAKIRAPKPAQTPNGVESGGRSPMAEVVSWADFLEAKVERSA